MRSLFFLSAFLLLFLQSCHQVVALAPLQPVSKLLSQHASSIAQLKDVCVNTVGDDALTSEPYSNDVFFLRYCLEHETAEERIANLKTTLAWRTNDGKSICESAISALQAATSAADSGTPRSWDNDPVLSAAPYSAQISQYLKPANVLTTTSKAGDLVYCIRAGQIDDVALMNAVTVEQLSEFFLYAKEINAMVANQRSVIDADATLKYVVTVNDLAGVKLVGGSADFRQALSASSKVAAPLYPQTAGVTLLVNLPKLVSALVKLFTPLFPPSVRARLKFQPWELMKNVDDLREITHGGASRAAFVSELELGMSK